MPKNVKTTPWGLLGASLLGNWAPGTGSIIYIGTKPYSEEPCIGTSMKQKNYDSFLVGGFNPSEKYVHWDDYSQYWEKEKMFQTSFAKMKP